MPPVIDRPWWQVVAAFDEARVFAQDVSRGRHDQPVRIDPQADRTVGKGGRNAAERPLEADQAGGRDTLAHLDGAVKGDGQRHQGGALLGQDIGNRAGQRTLCRLVPQVLTTLFQPGIERREIREGRHLVQQLVSRIPDVLLDLSFLPACRRIAELGCIDIVVCHREEAHVDLPLLAATDTVHRRLHVIVDPASGNAAEHAQPMPMRIKQHLMGLQ